MNITELQRALRQLRLGGIAAVLETRLHQAQAEAMAPIDLISCLISDELTRRSDRLLERRRKQAGFRDANRTLDGFDFTFNPKMNRGLVFDLATCGFIGKREDALFLGPGDPETLNVRSRVFGRRAAFFSSFFLHSRKHRQLSLPTLFFSTVISLHGGDFAPDLLGLDRLGGNLPGSPRNHLRCGDHF